MTTSELSSASVSSGSASIESRILNLKKKHNALILAHYYQEGDIQDIADEVGDSLQLAQAGQTRTNPVILLAGVVFMAESVKILSPEKKVLVPDLGAGCSLVTSSPFEKWVAWRRRFPDHLAVTYVNSSAHVKAASDVICTSSNAEKIIAAIPKDRGILFGPDKQLGKFLSKQSGREMKFWEGACEVHILFHARQLFELKQQHPDAIVIAHPECDDQVLSQCHVVGSTSRLLKEVQTNPAKKFIVATEEGIFHKMKKSRPDVTLIQAPTIAGCVCNQCPYMRLNNLEKIEKALTTLSPEIKLPPPLIKAARISLDRMMKITNGEKVTWPPQFEEPVLG